MPTAEDRAFFRRTLETSLRIGLIALLAFYCAQVARPFLHPLIWGAILAVALQPAHRWLSQRMAGREGLAATTLAIGFLLLLAIPSAAIVTNLVESAAELGAKLDEGSLRIPPPPASVADWPLVGEGLHARWASASRDLEAAIGQAGPTVKSLGAWLLSTAAAAGFASLIFLLSILVAAVLLANGDSVVEQIHRLSRRLTTGRGDELVGLARDTIQSVTLGILGVAVIQALLSGLALVVVGVPAAGLWALAVLLMAVVQLPTVLVLGPIVVYVFATSSTWIAIPFAIWTLTVAFSDNFLKPMLLGRGVSVPTLVIFVGAIGGFILEGIIGLFVGAVALAVAFALFKTWLEDTP